MSGSLDFVKPGRKIHVGVILMGSTTELLDVAPVHFFEGISKDFADWAPPGWLTEGEKAQAWDADFHWVNEKGEEARLTSGLRLLPTDSFATCPPLDIALMGAAQMSYEPTEAELDFIRKTYDDCSAFITICGGFQAPMQAGLFKGKTVTAPQPMLERLRQQEPDTEWVEKRWHRDGKLWTSGTLLNGLDLMRGFGEEIFGKGTLAETMLQSGNWPRRAIDYSDGP